MHYLDCREEIQHRTGDVPLAHYDVDEKFPRYRMPVHWHSETELVYVRSGRFRLYLDGREVEMEAGDLSCIGSGVIHGGEPEGCVYECIVFDPMGMAPDVESVKRRIKALLSSNILLKNSLIEANPELKKSIEGLFGLCKGGLIGREAELIGAMFAFLPAVLGAGSREDMVKGRNLQRAEQLKPALEYIEQHYSQHISLETLAGLSGFSPKYFCRYFRSLVHRSPIDYLNFYRAERAASFLAEADMTVEEVAMLCGYADSSAFIKQFKKYKGATPKQYKNKMRAF